jgi:uncharacterized protein YqhQ
MIQVGFLVVHFLMELLQAKMNLVEALIVNLIFIRQLWIPSVFHDIQKSFLKVLHSLQR